MFLACKSTQIPFLFFSRISLTLQNDYSFEKIMLFKHGAPGSLMLREWSVNTLKIKWRRKHSSVTCVFCMAVRQFESRFSCVSITDVSRGLIFKIQSELMLLF